MDDTETQTPHSGKRDTKMAKTNSKATNRSATHQGTCQICGRQQMLPGGKLAKHGYTTRWGFFSGTCTGSGWGPFETHCDKIEDAIVRATDHAAYLRTKAAELKASKDVTKVWRHVYQSATWKDRTSRYVWQLLDIVDGTVTEMRRDTNGTEQAKVCKVADYNETLEQAVAAQNARRAGEWLAEAVKYDEYVAWQTKRLATWTAQPEKLVALDRTNDRKGPLVHFGLHWSGRGRACASSVMASYTGHTTTEMAKVTCDKCKKTGKWQEAVETAAKHGGSYTLRYKDNSTVKVVA